MNSTAHVEDEVRSKELEVALRGEVEWEGDGRGGPDAARRRWTKGGCNPFASARVGSSPIGDPMRPGRGGNPISTVNTKQPNPH